MCPPNSRYILAQPAMNIPALRIARISLILTWLASCSSCVPRQMILGRSIRLDTLCDDFEDPKWHFDYQTHVDYRGFWRTDDHGEPDLLRRIKTPDGGKAGSGGALELRTNDNDAKPDQDCLLTIEFKNRRTLTRADQPVFIVRVWLPPFEEWNAGVLNFGFRQTARIDEKTDYYQSIWLFHDGHKPLWFLRNGIAYSDGTQLNFNDMIKGYIAHSNWWTLAIAYDERGVGHYYAAPGTDTPTEKDELINTSQFTRDDGLVSPFMDHMGYSFFSLGYPADHRISPRFVIDDYEVWVMKR